MIAFFQRKLTLYGEETTKISANLHANNMKYLACYRCHSTPRYSVALPTSALKQIITGFVEG